MFNELNDKTLWRIVTAIATIIGAYGGFPTPPKIFQDLVKFKLVQWLLVFILVYQGGSGQDSLLSLYITVGMFIVHTILDKYSMSSLVTPLQSKQNKQIKENEG
jgi:hypothetical protein